MLRKFVSGVSVAAVIVCFGAVAALLVPNIDRGRVFPVVLIWVCVPAVWGVWAMLTPRSWFPQRLPAWGALLGLIAGVNAEFVLNVRDRFFRQAGPRYLHVLVLIIAVVLYYVLWMLVRRVVVSLQGTREQPTPTPVCAA